MKQLLFLGIAALGVAFFVLPLGDRFRPHADTSIRARQLVKDLIEDRDRPRAICQLIEMRRYRTKPRYEIESCTTRQVRHFIGSPTSEAFGVTLEVDYLDNVRQSPIAGELILFDREGFLIPVYHGANLLESADGVLRYQGDERWAIAHVIATKAEEHTTTQILNIVPVADPQHAVLRVILGPPVSDFGNCEGFTWSWHANDLDGDGIPEIEIGPNVNAQGDIEPQAIFRWSVEEQRYIGPATRPEDDFVRIDDAKDCCGNDASKRFSEELARRPAAVRTGVRRPRCDASATLFSVP